jgi:hypothetical protein
MDRLHNKPARSFSSEQDSRDSTYMAHSGGLDDQHERRRPASRQSLAQVLQASDSIAGQTEGLSAFTGVPSKPKSGDETCQESSLLVRRTMAFISKIIAKRLMQPLDLIHIRLQILPLRRTAQWEPRHRKIDVVLIHQVHVVCKLHS